MVSRTHVVTARLRPRSGGGREGYLIKRTQINGCAIRASDESKKEARSACDPRGLPFPKGHRVCASVPGGGSCCLVVQSSLTLRHRGLWPTRLLCPWDPPGKNTGAGLKWHVVSKA